MVKKNLTRKLLTNKIHKSIGFSKNFSSEIIDNFFKTITNALIKDNEVKISSFGTFKVLSKKERVGRNPKTKILAKISKRKVVNFKPAASFKEKINK
jgi:integration host factor subunit alpha